MNIWYIRIIIIKPIHKTKKSGNSSNKTASLLEYPAEVAGHPAAAGRKHDAGESTDATEHDEGETAFDLRLKEVCTLADLTKFWQY